MLRFFLLLLRLARPARSQNIDEIGIESQAILAKFYAFQMNGKRRKIKKKLRNINIEKVISRKICMFYDIYFIL